MTDDRKNPLGPTGTCVQSNVTRFRQARGLTKKDLSVRVGKLGRPIPPLGISRLEDGKRRVDSDDLVALALALNVNPLRLLLPPESVADYAVAQLTPEVEALVTDIWRWATGVSALPAEPGDRPTDAEQEAYELLTLSGRDRYLKGRPASSAATVLHDDVDRVVELSQTSSRPDVFTNRLAAARSSIARLAAELDRVELDHADLMSDFEDAKTRKREEMAELQRQREEERGDG